MNFQKIIHFIKYHNAFTIAAILIFAFSASVFASPAVREATLGKTVIEQEGIDNSALLSANLDNFNFRMRIDNVSQDEENYYVDYSYESLGINENIWQGIMRAETITVPKSMLLGKDLGLYITEELRETMESELAYLKEVQEKQKQKGKTFVVETTKYTGMIGLVMNPQTKVLSGYEPVVKPVKHEPIVENNKAPSQSEENIIDEGNDQETTVLIYYYDSDGDGYGDSSKEKAEYHRPEGYVANGDDCNDLIANINPGATEICDDGLDNDCDGKIDFADKGCQPDSESSEEACDASHLDLCLTEEDCLDVQGYWYDETCYAEAKNTEETGLEGESEDVYGCTDPSAENYNASATIDDKSCEYPEIELPSETEGETPAEDTGGNNNNSAGAENETEEETEPAKTTENETAPAADEATETEAINQPTNEETTNNNQGE